MRIFTCFCVAAATVLAALAQPHSGHRQPHPVMPVGYGIEESPAWKSLDVRGHAAESVAPAARAGRAPSDGRDYVALLTEDFSRFTQGSVTQPTTTPIENPDREIPASYTSVPGWRGDAILQAGGAVAIGMTTDPYTHAPMTGQIETPVMDLHRHYGKAYVSFRAKVAEPYMVPEGLHVRWIADADEENPMGSAGETLSFDVMYSQWYQFSNVELTDCPANARIQFWCDAYTLLLDDIVVEQYQPEIEAPEVLKWTDYTDTSFTARWTPVEGADHYIFNLYTITKEADEDFMEERYYPSRYKDKVLTGTSIVCDKLNRDRIYYYYVQAVNANGTVSESSSTAMVVDVMAPTGIETVDVTNKGFGVRFSPAYHAHGYAMQTVLTHTAPADEEYALIDEDFSGVVVAPENGGTIDNPYIPWIGYVDMDEDRMMKRSGWVLYEGGLINGAICMKNTSAEQSTFGEVAEGELISPILSIGQSGGKVTISADFLSTDGVRPEVQIAVTGEVDGKTTWVKGGGRLLDAATPEWTRQTYTCTIAKPGLIRFSILCDSWDKLLFIDNLKITVDLPKGHRQLMPYAYFETQEQESPSFTCPTTDLREGDTYSYSLMSVRIHPNSGFFTRYVYSDWTETIQVPAMEPDADGIAAVTADTDAPVEYYDLTGRRLSHPAQGVVCIRRQGSQVTKVVVRSGE